MSDLGAKEKIKPSLQSGLGVAAVSISGYLIGFCYELGYTAFFAIPLRFIKLNLITIFTAIFGLFALIVIVGLLINAVYPFLPKRTSFIYRSIIRASLFFVIFLVLLVIYRETALFAFIGKMCLLFIALWLFGEFVWPLITQRGKGTYIEKLTAQEDLENYWTFKTLLGSIANTSKGFLGFRLVLGLLLLLMFSFCIGNSAAMRKKHFLILDGKKDTVVLRIYNDKLICAPFNKETKEVNRSLIILESSGKNELRLNWEKVGPLKLADKKDK